MRLPNLTDKQWNVVGAVWIIVSLPALIPIALATAVLVGAVLAKRWAIGPRKEWGKWFAWYAANVGDVFDPDWRWLEIVERQSWAILNDTSYRARVAALEGEGE